MSRTRTRDVRGMCERCAGLHDGTPFGLPKCVVREHEHCSTRLEACLDCQFHTCAVWAVFLRASNSLTFAYIFLSSATRCHFDKVVVRLL